MMTFLRSLAVLVLFSVPGSAQQIIADYDARLGPQDRVNSRGVPLGNLCAIVQQDRANYHRFGRRDSFDTFDPIFADKGMRGLIARTCETAPGFEYLWTAVPNGGGFGYIVRVLVLNDNGTFRVVLSERAG